MKKVLFVLVTIGAIVAIVCTTTIVPLRTATSTSAISRQQDEAIFGPPEMAARGGGGIIRSFDTHTHFHTREQQQHIVRLSPAVPTGMPIYSPRHSCGVTGGMHIIGGHNALHTNFIPGFNSTVTVAGIATIWNSSPSPARTAVENELHQRMGGGQGLTRAQYFNGMTSFAQSRGRAFQRQSMMSGNNLNLQNLKAQLRQNRYATIFMVNSFNVSRIMSESGRDRFLLEEWGANHIMAVFGYRTITYRNASGQIIRTKNFLEVITGVGTQRGLLYLNGFGTISNVYMTHFS